ncbi:Retrovirus-related Pol polyprotein from transposon TNT 1-94 [Sesamum angolense]|uniref:Retrovirus-related Pol polyprotein from transposon TNT 1-94 n=1 Tax=Sesamum angolense TaxID=2727404 RepID=A0AAE1WWL9_9LAMI|nr:Retrovirus-related Pol polyprotein from transposon TNT 1-94 [Sesamum angolense]
MVVGGSSGASTSGAKEGYVSVQPELLIIYEPCDWLIDTGANVHVCADKSLFVSYQAITRKTVSMGNSSTAEVLGIGSVDLKFPSGRILSLKIVHHVPTVRRNIISGSSPTNHWVTKVFVGRGFEYGLPYSERSPSETQYEYSFRIVESTSLTHEELDIPRRSKRATVVKDFGSDFVTYNIEDDPVTFKDAMASSEAKQWKEAVKSEMDSIVSNGTWVLVDLPPGCTTIGSRLTTIRVLIALASVYNLSIHQMDVKTDFLYGELDEEIYMDQPEGFVAHGNKRKIIEKFGYQNSRIAKTPYDSSVALFKNESGVSVAQLRYSQIIGSLQYLANGTKPDILFSVSKLSRYTSCPDKTHWGVLDMILRYLKDTVSLAIHYGRFPAVLEGYSDASWIAKNSGSNGCSGYVFTLGGGAVSWKSAKQTLITRSTFEAELYALDTTGTEAE